MTADGASVGVLYSSFGREVDGVLDYARRLTHALSEDANVASALLVDRVTADEWAVGPSNELRDAAAAFHALSACDVVVVQYSPFGHGRWGRAPWLVDLVTRLADAVRVAVMVHEPYLVRTGVRDAPISWLQRRQLRALLGVADIAFTSIEPWVKTVAALAPAALPVHHLPVASNLPTPSLDHMTARRALEIADGERALATISSGHDSRSDRHIIAAVHAVHAAGLRPVLLDLGGGARGFDGLPDGLRVIRPGFLPAQELADVLVAADLYLAPLVDGVSTRRTSMMAALACGVAVVGTFGHLTDAELRSPDVPLTLVDIAEEPGTFGDSVVRLVADDAARGKQAQGGRQLHEQRFAPSVTASRLVELAGGASA